MATSFQCKVCDSEKPEETPLLCHGACKRQLHAICAGIKIAKTATTVHAFLQQNRNNFKFVCQDCVDLDSKMLLDAIKSLDSKILQIDHQNEKFLQHEQMMKTQHEMIMRIEDELKKCLNIININNNSNNPPQPNFLLNPFASNLEVIRAKRSRSNSEIHQEGKAAKAQRLTKKKKKAAKPVENPNVQTPSLETLEASQQGNTKPTQRAPQNHQSRSVPNSNKQTSYRDVALKANSSKAANDVDEHAAQSSGVAGVAVRKYIYVSRLQTTTTELKLKKFITDKFGIATENIECKLLVSADTDMSTLSFVSYRVLVPSSDYNRLLQRTGWPTNVISRPFKESSRASQNFRLKQQQTFVI